MLYLGLWLYNRAMTDDKDNGGYSLEGQFDAQGGIFLRCHTCGNRQKLHRLSGDVECSGCGKVHRL